VIWRLRALREAIGFLVWLGVLVAIYKAVEPAPIDKLGENL
jgi:hypothetical protein